MLYTDIPTSNEFHALDAVRADMCVSIYLPTTPVTSQAKGDRILFKNLASEAIGQLRATKANARKISGLESLLEELHADEKFWAYVADGLAVFATPDKLRTFRLPIAPGAAAEVSDRFHVKPLVPLLAFSGACFVLALSQGATRLIEVTAGLAETIKVEGLPKTMSDAVKRSLPRDRAPSGRIQGSEGMKVLTAQYCRGIDRALRPILSGRTIPLVLASVDELAAIYRSVNSYPHLAKTLIKGNAEHRSAADLAIKARDIVFKDAKKIVGERLRQVQDRLERSLASTDLSDIARAAVRGQVATLLLDPLVTQYGTIDPDTGALELAQKASAASYDIMDELVGLTVRMGGEVLPVSHSSLVGGSSVAALFRYAG